MVVKRIERYGATRSAEWISTQDLWSKLHLGPRWPFLQLRHGGNLGRLMPRMTRASLRRLFVHHRDAATGCWLMLVAQRGLEVFDGVPV